MALTMEQKQFRRRGISASDVATICGLNPWRRPVEVWESKILEPTEDDPTEDMERGNELENALLGWMGRRTQRRIEPNTGPSAITYRSKTHDLVLATPDGIVIGAQEYPIAVAEVKSPGTGTAKDWTDPTVIPDGIPEYYLPQVTWQMAALDLPEAFVGALVGGKLWTYQIQFNRELFELLLKRAEEFWMHVVRREPPPVDGSSAYTDALRKRFASSRPIETQATNELAARIEQFHEIKRHAAGLETQMEIIKQEVMAHMGDAELMHGPWGKVLWRAGKAPRRLDKKLLESYCKEHDIEIDQFYAAGDPSRPLRITEA